MQRYIRKIKINKTRNHHFNIRQSKIKGKNNKKTEN